jgi:hypothetical protein
MHRSVKGAFDHLLGFPFQPLAKLSFEGAGDAKCQKSGSTTSWEALEVNANVRPDI